MRCSICGCEGHNARSCPNRQEDRDHALWVKVDGLTEREATKLQSRFMEDKSKIAPKARGTSAKGTTKELPDRIKDALKLLEDKNEPKKK